MSKYNLTDLYEEMRPKDREFEDAKEKERLEKHPERDKIKAVQAMMAKEKGMKENYQMDGETYDRIDGLISQPLLKSLLGKFREIYYDFLKSDDLFDADDVVDYLTIQLDKVSKADKMSPDMKLPKSDAEMDDDEREDFYLDLDSMDEVKEHFNRFK